MNVNLLFTFIILNIKHTIDFADGKKSIVYINIILMTTEICKHTNSGKFCSDCGTKKPDEPLTKIAEKKIDEQLSYIERVNRILTTFIDIYETFDIRKLADFYEFIKLTHIMTFEIDESLHHFYLAKQNRIIVLNVIPKNSERILNWLYYIDESYYDDKNMVLIIGKYSNPVAKKPVPPKTNAVKAVKAVEEPESEEDEESESESEEENL